MTEWYYPYWYENESLQLMAAKAGNGPKHMPCIGGRGDDGSLEICKQKGTKVHKILAILNESEV